MKMKRRIIKAVLIGALLIFSGFVSVYRANQISSSKSQSFICGKTEESRVDKSLTVKVVGPEEQNNKREGGSGEIAAEETETEETEEEGAESEAAEEGKADTGETETEETETEETETEETDTEEAETEAIESDEIEAEAGDIVVMDSEVLKGTYYAPRLESMEQAWTNWNTEEYYTVGDSQFRDTSLYPLSTFGMDVDTASYALLRRNLLNGTLENFPKDALRIEEMINYFSYEYEAPKEGETFSVTAMIAPCPWNEQTKLMLIGIQARDISAEDIPDQNLVFLIDVSGSMYEEDKLPLAIDSLKYLMNELDKDDTISIVTYAGSSEVVLEGEHCSEEGKRNIISALDLLSASGSTYGEEGIRTAYDLARESFAEDGNNRVILLTDGDFNVGQTDDSELVSLVSEESEDRIFLSVLGFGSGNYNDALAEELADKGNGNYSYIDSDIEARRVMQAELKGTLNTVAKDAKVQVDFNSAQVKGYRLIGYENRVMDAEDFEDDSKDGGEVGAGQQVTVLYELVMDGSDYEIPAVHSRYDQSSSLEAEEGTALETEAEDEAEEGTALETEVEDEAEEGTALDREDGAGVESQEILVESAEDSEGVASTSSLQDEYLTISIRYKNPDADTSFLTELSVDRSNEISTMTDDMSWAAGVAQAGMLLRESEFAGTSNYEDIRNRLKELTYDDEYREEFEYLLARLNLLSQRDDE